MNSLALVQAAEAAPFFDWTSTDTQLTGWLVCFFTLAIFSFLYKDNPFYKIAEHVFVGIGTAYFALQYYDEGILGPIVEHVTRAGERADAQQLMELGGVGVDPAIAIGLRIMAAVLALMLLSRVFAPTGWAPRWPLALMVGIYAALKMTGETQSKLVQQIQGVVKDGGVTAPPGALSWSEFMATEGASITATAAYITLGKVVLVVGLLSALIHFMFTFKRGTGLNAVSRVGIVTLMLTFGAMFGFTVLGRIALLIERIENVFDFAEPQYALDGATTFLTPPALITTVIILVLVLRKVTGKDGEAA